MKTYLIHFVLLILCSIVPTFIVASYFGSIAIVGNSLNAFSKELPSLFYAVTAISFVHALLLGLPLYLLVKKYNKFNYFVTAVCGFLVGALPKIVYSWPYSDPGSSATYNGVQAIVNGIPTTAGWLLYFRDCFIYGVLGLFAALVFKYLLLKLQASNKSLNQDATSVAPIS